MQLKNFKKIVNGDSVIGFTTSAVVKDMHWQDRSTIASWYKEDPTKHHLGLVELFTNFADVRVPMYKGLFENKAVLNVLGADGTFTYDLPVVKPTGTFTMADTSDEHNFPGIDEGYFTVALSKPYRPGESLTYDVQNGEQFIISEDHEVRQEGDYFVHTVQLVTTDKRKWFPAEKLRPGIQYFKVGQNLGEYSTQFGGIESPNNVGTLTCEFVLGNHRGFETFYTQYADMKSMAGATLQTKNFLSYFTSEMEKFRDDQGRELNMMYMAKINPQTQKMKGSTLRIGATLEYLTILENIKIEATQLLFQKGGVIKGNNGVKRMNEGWWHQVRRGRVIKYSRPGGLTREHIRQAVAYVFQGRPDLRPSERYIKFKAGGRAYENVMAIFSEEVNRQVQNLGNFLGTDRVLPQSPITGSSLTDLKLGAVEFIGVYVPDIGNIEIEYEPAMNYQPMADRASRGMYGKGEAHDTYSLVIWNAASEQYSNARTNLPAGTTLVDGGNARASVYYVKPEGESMWWGYEQGRWAPDKTGDIVSSVKTMSKTFWVHSMSACWVPDVSLYLVIELARS